MPRVTVVMAMYNAAQFLHQAVASVLAQTYRDFELIVVDDASTDDSLSVLEGFSDPRMRIIRHRTNMGAALSRNDALSVASGEFVAIMDADDVCAPARLERQVAFLDANPQAGLVGCGIYDVIDESGEILYTAYLPEDNETIQKTLVQRWCFLHPSIMFRRELLRYAGGYREVFEPAEDHDFILRILEHCEPHNLSERLVSYRLNPKGLSVIGHRYINELGNAAMHLAQCRRSGKPEDLAGTMAPVLELKRRCKTAHGMMAALQTWLESLYAANRFYGFGCRELCAGRMDRARRCFLRSLRTNRLFVKSWAGVVLTLIPFVASRLKFLFRSSMQDYDNSSRGRAVSRYGNQMAAVGDTPPGQ